MWYIYTMEYYSAIKENKIMPFAATWMELETLILSEVKQERERQIPYDTTYIWNRNIAQMNLSTETKIMDMENRLGVAKGEGEGVGWVGNLGLTEANYCLWISNEILLYGTGNYI